VKDSRECAPELYSAFTITVYPEKLSPMKAKPFERQTSLFYGFA
jgi:hypothetical protein